MILFSSEAISDVDRIRHFLEVRNPGAARRTLRAIWVALARVEEFPDLGQPVGESGIRQIGVRFGRRGYLVRYRVLPTDGTILVTRLWHSRETRN